MLLDINSPFDFWCTFEPGLGPPLSCASTHSPSVHKSWTHTMETKIEEFTPDDERRQSALCAFQNRFNFFCLDRAPSVRCRKVVSRFDTCWIGLPFHPVWTRVINQAIVSHCRRYAYEIFALFTNRETVGTRAEQFSAAWTGYCPPLFVKLRQLNRPWLEVGDGGGAARASFT